MTQSHYDILMKAAQTLKSDNIRLCQQYLEKAKAMELTEKSTSVRKWRNQLTEWQEMPLYQVMRNKDAIAESGLTPAEAEAVLNAHGI